MLNRLILTSRRIILSNNRQLSSQPWTFERKHIPSTWRSDAEKRIAEVPVIEVPGRIAVCEGGSGALGHPIQYIQLDRFNPAPAVCKYCGLKYKMGKRYNRFGKEMKFDAH